MARLLIVDDDEAFASAAAKVLGGEGHEVRIELDTESALQSMGCRPPDLVILDVMFPENVSAGLELAWTIRHGHDLLREIPILLLTAVTSKGPLGFPSGSSPENEALAADFLEKPLDFDVLLKKVALLLGA